LDGRRVSILPSDRLGSAHCVRAGSGVVLGSIPVVLGTPVAGDHYAFEDCREGEIHGSVDFGTQPTGSSGGGGNGPTDLTLSGTTVAENAAVGTTIGTLSTTDPDVGDTFTYALVAGDGTLFEIVGSTLRTKSVADFQAQSQYSVTIRTTDSTGQTLDKPFTLSVTNGTFFVDRKWCRKGC